MVHFLYDGSWQGLLTAIYQAYCSPKEPDRILAEGDPQSELFVENIPIVTDMDLAEKVSQSARQKISPLAWRQALNAFLSEETEVGTMIYRYWQYGWRIGRDLDRHLEDARVRAIHQLADKVTKESHRMKGLLRFQQVEGQPPFLYAPYSPDNNITGLVAPHFARRLANEKWIIHDLKRGLAALYNQKEWLITDFHPEQLPQLGQSEVAWQNLWQTYYHHLAIKERCNPSLQRRNMPMRYWQFLTETHPREYLFKDINRQILPVGHQRIKYDTWRV